MDITSVIFLLIGLALGGVIGFLVKKNNQVDFIGKDDTAEIEKEVAVLNERLQNAGKHYSEQKQKIDDLLKEKDLLLGENAQVKATNKNLENRLVEQKDEIEKLQEKFTLEFTNIANKLLKQNSSELVETNQKRLDEILKPLKENIKHFEQKVDDKYEKELKERTSLMEQIKSLSELNQQMRTDAQSLTKALKGDSKTQGNWGELILEKILESSGLIKGEEYQTQYATTNDEGSRVYPDVVIKLPDEKHIVIDSKVSITAYTNYLESDVDEDKLNYEKAHLISVKKHIDELSAKNYANAVGIDSPDFVLMFMPSEPSFSFTLHADSSLYNYAWDRKIVIVSPTTLLATLKTVASVWKQERQTKNALEIARQSGALYDKFVGFIEDLEKIEKGLKNAKGAYDGALNKLKTGSGNLIGRAEKIKALGAKTKKEIPSNLREDANLLDENE